MTTTMPISVTKHGRCAACGTYVVRHAKGYLRETSGSSYIAGRRFAHRAHTAELCQAREAENAAELASMERADAARWADRCATKWALVYLPGIEMSARPAAYARAKEHYLARASRRA